MVQPRVFVSSTYYDLKHIRSSLEHFIDSLGFETILTEKGNIAFSPAIPLDESCYKEVENSDILIIIIGGRYGSERSGSEQQAKDQFYDRYESITKTEYVTAINRDIPTYILIEKSVYADYETFLKNKTNDSIDYAHVDSVNIFYLIEEILSQPKNNPVHQFDRYSDIEAWLKEQWAGLFRELLNQHSNQIQITSLTYQISQLEEINKTLKRYLEEIILKVSPEISGGLIADESKRLEISLQMATIENNSFFKILNEFLSVQPKEFHEAIISSESIEDFFEYMQSILDKNEFATSRGLGFSSKEVIEYLRKARKDLNLEPLVLKQKNHKYFNLEDKRKSDQDRT